MPDTTPIAELMARDPLLLSKQDLDTIIADLRLSRSRFVLADDKKIGTPAARKSGAQKDREARSKILDQTSIDDLFKDL
jgi:hypothetical protein